MDTATAPQAEKELDALLESAQRFVLDLASLKYLSSAGLRLIFKMNKTMKEKGGMAVKNVNETIMEIFDMTGFTSILDIE